MNALEELAPLRPLPAPPGALTAVRGRAARRRTQRHVALALTTVVAFGLVAGAAASVVSRLSAQTGDRVIPMRPSPVPTGTPILDYGQVAAMHEAQALAQFPPTGSSSVTVPLSPDSNTPPGATRSLFAWYSAKQHVVCAFERVTVGGSDVRVPVPTSSECRVTRTSKGTLLPGVLTGMTGYQGGWIFGVAPPDTVRMIVTTPSGAQPPLALRTPAGWRSHPVFAVSLGPRDVSVPLQVRAYDARGRMIWTTSFRAVVPAGLPR